MNRWTHFLIGIGIKPLPRKPEPQRLNITLIDATPIAIEGGGHYLPVYAGLNFVAKAETKVIFWGDGHHIDAHPPIEMRAGDHFDFKLRPNKETT